MNDIIMDQIDIVVVGDKQHQLITLMLEQDIIHNQNKKKITHQKYLDVLSNLVGNAAIPEPTIPTQFKVPQKYTKIIQTQNFWIHFHFFVHDNKIFDPFISSFSRGNASICLIAASQKVDIIPAKNYLNHSNAIKPFISSSKDFQAKNEAVLQAQILSSAHQLNILSFPAVLALKITEQKRIIQQSSNLRLTVNQISRWIVDRHFQIKQRIKLKQGLGDQIQNYVPSSKKETQFCNIY